MRQNKDRSPMRVTSVQPLYHGYFFVFDCKCTCDSCGLLHVRFVAYTCFRGCTGDGGGGRGGGAGGSGSGERILFLC